MRFTLLSIVIDHLFSSMYSIILFGYFTIIVGGVWAFSSFSLIMNYGAVNVTYIIFSFISVISLLQMPKSGMSESLGMCMISSVDVANQFFQVFF